MTKAEFTSYRVNAYDFKHCQYTVLNNVSGTVVNGGNATQSFSVDYPLYNLKSLPANDSSAMSGSIGTFLKGMSSGSSGSNGGSQFVIPSDVFDIDTSSRQPSGRHH